LPPSPSLLFILLFILSTSPLQFLLSLAPPRLASPLLPPSRPPPPLLRCGGRLRSPVDQPDAGTPPLIPLLLQFVSIARARLVDSPPGSAQGLRFISSLFLKAFPSLGLSPRLLFL